MYLTLELTEGCTWSDLRAFIKLNDWRDGEDCVPFVVVDDTPALITALHADDLSAYDDREE